MLRRHSSLWAPRSGFGLQALGPLRGPGVDSCLILTSVTTPVTPAAGPQTGSPRTDFPRQALPKCSPLSCLFSPFPLLPPPPMLPQTWMLTTASSLTPCPQPLPLKSVLTQTPAFYCVHSQKSSTALLPELTHPTSVLTLLARPLPLPALYPPRVSCLDSLCSVVLPECSGWALVRVGVIKIPTVS